LIAPAAAAVLFSMDKTSGKLTVAIRITLLPEKMPVKEENGAEERTQEGSDPLMKSHPEYLWFNTQKRRKYINITSEAEKAVRESGIKEGMA